MRTCVCWMPACATRPKAIRHMLSWEYITSCITHGSAQFKHVGIRWKFPYGEYCMHAPGAAAAADWWNSKISLGAVLSLFPLCLCLSFGSSCISLSVCLSLSSVVNEICFNCWIWQRFMPRKHKVTRSIGLLPTCFTAICLPCVFITDAAVSALAVLCGAYAHFVTPDGNASPGRSL